MASQTKNWLTRSLCPFDFRSIILLLPLWLVGMIPLTAQTVLENDLSCVIKEVSYHPVSINLNYLTDGDDFLNSENPTEVSLKQLGVRFLRFPGGEKSDNYFWSVPPFQGVDPHFAVLGDCNWPNNDSNWSGDFEKPKEYTLDFDEFITLCQKIQAEPFIVVPGDPQHFNDPGCTYYPTLAEVAEVAKEWVRYANITRDLNIKYWMIGNESWNSAAYDNGVSPTEYRDDFKVIASAMKSIDPSIKIVANSRAGNYLNVLLQDSVAQSMIDYVAISNYPVSGWNSGYNDYVNSNPNFVGKVKSVLNGIDDYAPDSDIEVIVSEYNAIDWASNGWSNSSNDLGHALVVFQMLGDHLEQRRLHNLFYWNTRWVSLFSSLYNAIDIQGNLNATGKAISIWGHFLLDKLVSSDETTNIRSYTTKSDDQQELNIFILNKSYSTQSVDFIINRFLDTLQGSSEITFYEFSGVSVLDNDPTFEQIVKPYTLSGKQISLDLAPTSVTVISIKATQPTALSNLCSNNLIVENSGFESGDFQGWMTSGEVEINQEAYSGAFSARLKGLGSFAAQQFDIKEGDSCRIHAFAKRIDGTTTGTLRIRFFDQNEEVLDESNIPFNLSKHYEPYEFLANAPPNSKKIEIRFFNNHNQGIFFLDNICFSIENATNTTSLEEEPAKSISVFPNPTSDLLTVYFEPNHSFRRLALFDLNGALILEDNIENGIEEWPVSLKGLASGLYMLQVFSDQSKEALLVRKE